MKNPFHILNSTKAFGKAVREAAKKKEKQKKK
jgi:hypothetical protein